MPRGLETPWHRLAARAAAPHVVGADVLEIACGQGALTVHLAGAGAASVTAADLSSVAVARAAEACAAASLTGVRVEVADVQALPYADACFDLVVSCETIEHVPRPAQAVRELARVLRPGGRLVLTTPNYLNLLALQRAYRRAVGRPYTEGGQPVNRFLLLPVTAAWVRLAGLVVEEVDATEHHLPFPREEGPFELPVPPRLRRPLRWFAANSVVVARRPR